MEHIDALVIGAGPAGLMAAEKLARAGRRVVIAEAKPSPARKFLMAGKSGLNLTKDEAPDAFLGHFREAAPWLAPMLAAFGPAEVQDWSRRLGQPVFTGSSGRVFPVSIKGSPLLRAWLARLDAKGVALRVRWRWTGFGDDGVLFDTPAGPVKASPRVTVLALGGASWTRLGSDGAWVPILTARGVPVAPWQPANMGVRIGWSAHMARHFGAPLKGLAFHAGDHRTRGEATIVPAGLEGGGIYAVSRALRDGASLRLDLMPDLAGAEIVRRLQRMRAGETTANRLRKLGLGPASVALMMEFARGIDDPGLLAARVKSLSVPVEGPFPIEGAISVAGGIRAEGLTGNLELRAIPRVFACGEMLDWEAPTGGYLLTACLATGRWAGRAAAASA